MWSQGSDLLSSTDVGAMHFGALSFMEVLQCAVVKQDEQPWAWLTSRESVHFALGLFRHGLRGAELKEATEQMLAKTGLVSCADVKSGSSAIEEMAGFFRGLSGGQRRRLSLAIALAKKPAVLMADEPTPKAGHSAKSSLRRRDSRRPAQLIAPPVAWRLPPLTPVATRCCAHELPLW